MSALQDAKFVTGFAYRDTTPGHRPTLHVYAVWVCPTTGYRLQLKPHRPAPHRVQLLLAETRPTGVVLPVETPVATDYSVVAPHPIKEVLILPAGIALPVLEVSLLAAESPTAAAELPEGAFFPTANHFELWADGHAVVYDATSITGDPVLTYNDLSFTGDALKIEDTPLGQVVTVLLGVAADGSATFLTVMMPPVRLDPFDDETAVETICVRSVYRSYIPPAIALGQLVTYEPIALAGKASFIVT